MIKKLISIGVVSLTFLLLIYFNPIWTRYPGGLWIPFIFLVIVALFLWLTIKLIKEVIGLIRNRKTSMWTNFLPSISIVAVICFTFFNTFSFDIEDRLFGKVILQAYYEGTQNQSSFKLRENNRFEIHSTGVFLSEKYFMGHYTKIGDTLNLVYDGDKNQAVGEKVYMNNIDEFIEPIKDPMDSTRRPLRFHYGYDIEKD